MSWFLEKIKANESRNSDPFVFVCVVKIKGLLRWGKHIYYPDLGARGGLWERDLNLNGMWVYTTRVGTEEVRRTLLLVQLLESWMLLLLKPFHWPPSMHLLRGS